MCINTHLRIAGLGQRSERRAEVVGVAPRDHMKVYVYAGRQFGPVAVAGTRIPLKETRTQNRRRSLVVVVVGCHGHAAGQRTWKGARDAGGRQAAITQGGRRGR